MTEAELRRALLRGGVLAFLLIVLGALLSGCGGRDATELDQALVGGCCVVCNPSTHWACEDLCIPNGEACEAYTTVDPQDSGRGCACDAPLDRPSTAG